jgi:hypothetical protein
MSRPVRPRKPVRITLESTDEVAIAPPPARVWRGCAENGAEVYAFISLATADSRLREALGTRILSEAVITIPRP